MFDSNEYLNNLFNTDYSSTTTETETESQSTYSPQTDYSSNSTTYERDDYSSAQNFTEQQSYNPFTSSSMTETEQTSKVSQMNTPMIEKSAPVVNLVKAKAKIRLETRMKIVLSVFSVIVACLLFVSVFNFISASKIESTFFAKQQQINSLEQSILASEGSYDLVSSDEYVDDWAGKNGYVDKQDGVNSFKININEIYEEEVLQEVPTNWFNDVCEFFSKLFAA
ncbi:MAG: hypothetical protein IKJ33_02895 [Clostridia bacterium]|nr:hypothetical protein [Clostridia bacterium]